MYLPPDGFLYLHPFPDSEVSAIRHLLFSYLSFDFFHLVISLTKCIVVVDVVVVVAAFVVVVVVVVVVAIIVA